MGFVDNEKDQSKSVLSFKAKTGVKKGPGCVSTGCNSCNGKSHTFQAFLSSFFFLSLPLTHFLRLS